MRREYDRTTADSRARAGGADRELLRICAGLGSRKSGQRHTPMSSSVSTASFCRSASGCKRPPPPSLPGGAHMRTVVAALPHAAGGADDAPHHVFPHARSGAGKADQGFLHTQPLAAATTRIRSSNTHPRASLHLCACTEAAPGRTVRAAAGLVVQRRQACNEDLPPSQRHARRHI